MMGASSSSDADQLLFVPTRRECLLNFSERDKVVSDSTSILVSSVMRFMKGDNPEVEMKGGTQKGGHRGCVGCDEDLRMAMDYELMARQQYKTLEEKQKRVFAAVFGKKVVPYIHSRI